jgi:16S rRNA (guanine(966)-N(2))-methyltransferase RsmD
MLRLVEGELMRVIAGEAKGRRLHGVRGQTVRPTADRVKEALFSILGSRFDLSGIAVLDLYAGSGGVGIEALSRGAAQVTFVEQHAPTCRVLRENLALCGFAEKSTVLCAPVRRALRMLAERDERYQGALIDPPYGRGLAAESLSQLSSLPVLDSGAWVVAEHHADDALETEYGFLRLTHTRRYGKTCLSLFQAGATNTSGRDS